MSLILNLETSSKNCSVSLSSKGKLIDLIESEDENYRHSELLTTSIQDILSKNNLNVNLGDVIFYVNNGERASHGDVQRKNKWKANAAEKRQYRIDHGKPMPPDSWRASTTFSRLWNAPPQINKMLVVST